MNARERDIFACLVDTVVAPVPPLPPVAQTDAVDAFDRWLTAAPRLNRAGLRAALLALGAIRLRRHDPAGRLRLLRRLPRELTEPLRAAAAMSYYGDAAVARLLGYDPEGAR
jgi:hypothetical protein